jgi:hypothetical protein
VRPWPEPQKRPTADIDANATALLNSVTGSSSGVDDVFQVDGRQVVGPERVSGKEIRAKHPSFTVRIRFVVDQAGNPRDFVVTQSGGAGLDARCLDALTRYRYRPAHSRSGPVAVLQGEVCTFDSR